MTQGRKQIHLVKFSKERDAEFFNSLRANVNGYFKEKGISKTGDWRMVLKTIAMLSIYFVPYAFMISGVVTDYTAFLTLWVFMGLGMAGIGFSVMHDANHGSYSKNEKVNNILGMVLNILGGYTLNWKIQHNQLHHSFTNIDGSDEDIDAPAALRFSPHKERRKFHRGQHLYAWFLYGLMTFFWSTGKDIIQIVHFKKNNLVKKEEYRSHLFKIIAWKAVYHGYLLVLPLVLLDMPAWLIIVGFCTLHFLAGFILSCVFQTAHVMPYLEYPKPDEEGFMESNWAVHQLQTTSNFAPRSRILTWFVGGLNYQVEHHLFPNVCHVHYPAISSIVEKTAKDYDIPYYSEKTFAAALWKHAMMLRDLGKFDHAGAPTGQSIGKLLVPGNSAKKRTAPVVA